MKQSLMSVKHRTLHKDSKNNELDSIMFSLKLPYPLLFFTMRCNFSEIKA